MNNKKELNKIFVENAVKEMEEIAKRALNYAKELKITDLDVEQDALLENFSREFNHVFSEVEIKK